MSDTADSIAARIVAETESAQRDVLACRARIERTMAGVEAAMTRAAAATEAAAKRQPAAGRDLGTARAKNRADAIDGGHAFRSLGAPGAAVAASRLGLDGRIAGVAGFLAAGIVPADRDGRAITPARPATPTQAAAIARLAEAVAALQTDGGSFELVDPEQIEVIGGIGAALKDDLANGLADAIVAGTSLGDVLVDSFARAGAALIESQITRLLDPGGDGSAGFVASATAAFAGLIGARRPPRRASGGQVSAGQLYRVNEVGIEGFRPAGSGRIVPLGPMAVRPTGGVTVVQPLNVSFAGAITTPELMAQFKAYADGVGQAAAIGGAAMAQARMAKRAARALVR